MYINGKWETAESGKTFTVYNPASGETIDTVPNGGKEDALLAIKAPMMSFLSGPKPQPFRGLNFCIDSTL